MLQEYEGEHGVGPEARVVRQEALPQRQDALVPQQGGHYRQLTLTFCRVLDSGLNDVDGHRGDGRDQPGHHGRAEVQRHAVGHAARERLPRLRVRAQLRRVHHHGASHRGSGAAPQLQHALLAHYPDQRVSNVLVIPPLLLGQASVSRHPYEGHFSRSADERANGPGGHAQHGLRAEARVGTSVAFSVSVEEPAIDSEPRGRVRCLSQ